MSNSQKQVRQYLAALPIEMQSVAQRLREIILSTIDVEERFAYGVPFYYGNKRVCYLNARKDVIDLGFCLGYLMRDTGLLEVKGRSEVRTIEFRTINDIDESAIEELLLEAFKLDQRQSKRSIKLLA